ncbi:MAG: response regulator [Planctomycetota bacterium]|jgi:two-component system chemotaxis response regulator CheY
MRILIVEDDMPSRQLMEMLLKGLGPCETAANGLEALEAVEQAMRDEDPYELVCMDVMMPEMNGLEALKRIRRLEIKHFKPGAGAAKIIMITARGQAKDVMGAYDSGCEAYMVKPISKAKLYDQLKELDLPIPDDA